MPNANQQHLTPSAPSRESEGAKHTPGPWAVKRSGTICQKESGDVIATCGFKVAVGSDEDDANARLIAAAPEMLEACRAAKSALLYGLGSEAVMRPGTEAFRAYNACASAITAAESL